MQSMVWPDTVALVGVRVAAVTNSEECNKLDEGVVASGKFIVDPGWVAGSMEGHLIIETAERTINGGLV